MEGIERELTALEAGRRGRLATVSLLLLASAVVAVLLLVAPEAGGALRVAAVVALAVVNLAYATSVWSRERAAARVVRELVAVRARHAAEQARERAFAAAHVASRSLVADLDLVTLAQRAVTAAARIVEADGAELALRVEDRLATAAVHGPSTLEAGERREPRGVEREVLDEGEARTSGRGAGWGDGPPTVLAPVALPDRIVGLLTVRRPAGGTPFSEGDRLAITLLAEHVALALRAATQHDRALQRAEALEAAFGDLADDLGRRR